MRRSRTVFFLGPFMLAAACGSFSGGEPTDEHAPVAEAGLGDETDAGTDETSDANDARDARADPADCSLIIDDDFQAFEKWVTYGTPIGVDAGELQLINGEKGQGAAIRWPSLIQADHFIVDATIRVGPDEGSGIGDAIAFSWLAGAPAYSTTSGGEDALVCGNSENTGASVYVDTSDLNVRVADIRVSSCTKAGKEIEAPGTTPHKLHFEVVGANVSGTYDAVFFRGSAPPSLAPFQFVISAASGGAHSAHYLAHVALQACP